MADFLHQNLTLIIRGSKCSEDRAHYIYDCFKETATPIMSIDYDLATKIYSVFYTAGGITTTKRVQFSNVPRVLESMPAISFKNVLVDITSLQHSVIVINRIGRCAGYWSVYTGMQKLISDCLIVVKEPSDATIEALRNHSENGRLQIPLRGVSTPYITIDDVRSLLLNN